MRILVVTFSANWGHHLETELEIIQSHLDDGDEVVVVGCFGDVATCYANPTHSQSGCWHCITRRYAGLSLLKLPPPLLSLDSYFTPNDAAAERLLNDQFVSVEAAKALRLNEFNIGFAALSSAISLSRDPYVTTTESQMLYRNAIHAAFKVYKSMGNFLHRQPHFDRAYVFNGRFEVTSAAFAAARKANLDVYLHERGSSSSRYALYKNRLPHDRSYFAELVEAAWADAEADPNREAIGEAFYKMRSNAKPLDWHSFVKEQAPGQLPDSWDDNKRNVVIFGSSEDEFAAIGDDWINPIYSSQYEALLRMIESIRGSANGTRLYLRMHPNLRGVDNPDLHQTMALNGRELEVIAPDSPVSSYTLLNRADCIVSFGSTMGIEAVYWGKPSVLAGAAFYHDLHGTYSPTSHEVLMRLLESNLPAMPVLPALKYGYYMATYGIPFKYYQAGSFVSGTFMGKQIEAIPGGRYMSLICRVVEVAGRFPLFCRPLVFGIRFAWHFLRRLQSARMTIHRSTQSFWRKLYPFSSAQ